MSAPKVSIIIPAYNSARFLRQTLESALQQDYDDFEVVVVDDGSTDETRALLEETVSSRLRVFYEPHAGCVQNYNRCLERARGTYIAILDHDDIMLAQRIRIQADFLDAHADIALVGSCYDVIGENGAVIERRPMPSGKDAIARFAMVFNAVQHPTVMYRAELPRKIGLYNEAYYPSHDSEFILRAIRAAGAENIPEYLTQWRKVQTSPTNAQHDQQRYMHYRMRKEINTEDYRKSTSAAGKRTSALNMSKVAYYYGNGCEARRWAFRALGHGLRSKELFRYLAASMAMPLVKLYRKHDIPAFMKRKKERSADWTYYSP